jgi:hypothetical protein
VYKGRDGKKKYEWMENKINVLWDSAAASGSPYSDSLYIDVAALLSAQNRKLVRQGQIFRIKNFRVFTKDTTDEWSFKIGVLPKTWMTRNAWVKAKALWDEMNAMAASNLGGSSIYPKWHDFKVYMNNAHRLDTGDNPDGIAPRDMDGQLAGMDEWAYSQYSDSGSTADNWFVHMLGDHVNIGSDANFSSVGIIQAYQESRVKLTENSEPDLPVNMQLSPWGRLFGDDDQTNDVVDRLDSDNDSPPYGDAYIGGSVHAGGHLVQVGQRLGTVNHNVSSATFSIPTFTAPLGLIRFEVDDDNNMTIGSGGIEISFEVEILGSMDM